MTSSNSTNNGYIEQDEHEYDDDGHISPSPKPKQPKHWMSLKSAFRAGHSCALGASAVQCGAQNGIFYQVNHGTWRLVRNVHTELPLQVRPNETLYVAVCGYNNAEYNVSTTLSTPLLPTLVSSVGADGRLVVHIANSSNVLVSQELTLKSNSRTRATLVAPSVYGPIGVGASVYVSVRDSGNVFLRRGAKKLELKNTELLAPSVLATTNCLHNACVEVILERVANVAGANGYIKIDHDGALISGAISARCGHHSSFLARIRAAGCVRHVKSFLISYGSELVGSFLMLGNASHCDIVAQAEGVGVIIAPLARVFISRDATLTRAALFLADTKSCTIISALRRVASVRAKSLVISRDASLITRTTEINGNAMNATIASWLIRSANIDVSRFATFSSNARCVQMPLYITSSAVNTGLQTVLAGTCNVRAEWLTVSRTASLVGEVVRAEVSSRVRFTVRVDDTANTFVRSRTTIGSSASLVTALLHVCNVRRSVLALLVAHRVANLECYGGGSSAIVGQKSHLIRDGLILDNVANNTAVKIGMHLHMIANAFAKLTGKATLIDSVYKHPYGVDKVIMKESFVGKRLWCSFK